MQLSERAALLQQQPHRRFNPLAGEWVFVSPHRTQRPWQGRQERAVPTTCPSYDSQCYLCPGNVRAGGERNPAYDSTYVFTNDFPALLPEVNSAELTRGPLLRAESQGGICRVICYSPRHDLTMGDMPIPQVRNVIDTWAAEVLDLRQRWRWVQIFENKGEMMGCSNAHPQGQIWASDFVPNEPAKELARQTEWFEAHKTPLLVEYGRCESEARERTVLENPHWLAVVPWWATWPYETLILPRRPVCTLPDLSDDERDALAELFSQLVRAYDNLFDASFPYSFGWHGADFEGCQLHAHFYPPLLRSASIRKFMVGYEMFAEPQRDITPEDAAELLRRSIEAHREPL
jgi:UDPglucose--hexose-1-phosphate uridylyltransferase